MSNFVLPSQYLEKKVFIYGFVIFIYVLLLLHLSVRFVSLRLLPIVFLLLLTYGSMECMYVRMYKDLYK
jgi:hypothetical protein